MIHCSSEMENINGLCHCELYVLSYYHLFYESSFSLKKLEMCQVQVIGLCTHCSLNKKFNPNVKLHIITKLRL